MPLVPCRAWWFAAASAPPTSVLFALFFLLSFPLPCVFTRSGEARPASLQTPLPPSSSLLVVFLKRSPPVAVTEVSGSLTQPFGRIEHPEEGCWISTRGKKEGRSRMGCIPRHWAGWSRLWFYPSLSPLCPVHVGTEKREGSLGGVC